MKNIKLALAVAATLVAGHAFAAPVTQADISSARTNGSLQESWISGASAPTYNIFQGFVAGCDENSVSVFHANGSSTTVEKPGSAGNYLAYACTRGAVVSVLYHTVDGGSFNAYAPHIPNDVDGDGTFGTTKLKRIKNLNTASNTTCAPQGTFSLPNQTAIQVYKSCSTVTPGTAADGATTVPAGGFSDVEAALFGVSVEGYGTEADANVGQVFGIATSIPLYRALQVAQGIYASVAAANSADASFLPANAPSLTKAQYASLATGVYATWDNLIPGSTKVVNIARRVATSGTQASSNAFFLRSPCNGDKSIGGALSPTKAVDSTSTYVVKEHSGTGDVKSAMNTTTEFVIGVMSLENAPTATYRFIKIDGVHPEAPVAGSNLSSDANARYVAAQALYDFHQEMKAFTASTADAFGAQIITEIKDSFATLNCADLPRGLTLNPLSGSKCGFDANDKNLGTHVAKGTRLGNNCQAQQLFN